MHRTEERIWSNERRQEIRAEIAMSAQYRILTRSQLFPGSAGRETPVATRVRNVSPGGVLLLVWERLMQHSVLSLSLALPGQALPVRTLAEVRHVQELFHGSSHPYAAGLEFLSISSRDTAELVRFVQNAKLS